MGNSRKLSSATREKYINFFDTYGEEGLYKRIVGSGLLSSAQIPDPEVRILDDSEGFFILFRRSGEEKFFVIGKVLRRAAHVIYRELMRQNKDRKPNFQRFLNAI